METQKFGRYIIIGEIGRGGMATVFHANDPRFEREVAIKVLPHEMLHDPQFRTRFEREAKTIAMLEHPAIVPVYDFGEEDGQPYFVMRYMTGGSLSDRLNNCAMPIKEAARIFERLAPALDSAHAKGIIHRDLKPGNILFDQYGEPYIADFGIAKLSEAQGSMTGSAIIGTPAYMSPEQAQGESIDGRSDIYGMGVILFEMLTGQQPFLGDTPMSVVLKHVTEPVPHILDVRPELPPAIEAIVEKALAKDRNERFNTTEEMAEALNRAARGESMGESSASDKTRLATPKTKVAKRSAPTSAAAKTVRAKNGAIPDATEPRKKGGAWIGIGIVALLLCVAAGAGAYLMRDKIPFLAALVGEPTATSQVISGISDTPSGITVTETNQAVLPVEITSTPSIEPTKKPATTGIGGADVIAFLSHNNLWIMKTDGSDLRQLTGDGDPKYDLQWSPDGTMIYFINGKCIQFVTLPDGGISNLTCFTAADYLDAFEISPDGTRVAISVDRILYVVAFAPEEIASARNHNDLKKLSVCLPYSEASASGGYAAKAVRWSRDGNLLAVNINSPQGGVIVDMIRVLDMSNCTSGTPAGVDNFPGARFKMNNYPTDPDLPYFSWDGDALFLLNSEFRYESGYMYVYNLNTKKGKMVDPMGTACCYSGATFSPDGSYFLFQYQDINISTPTTELYYILYGTEGGTITPFALPPEASNEPKYHFEAILRPIQ